MPVMAFDNDFEINDINLGEENFLDIKAHRFRKSLEYQWFDNTSAWRITGASLDENLAFLQTEIKLQQELSDYLNARLAFEQEVFYADKETPSPTVEVEIYPWAGDLGFSVLGTPAYQKQEMDIGFALIWGRRPWDFIRLEYLQVDSLYNQKNVRDNSFYRNEPETLKLDLAYQISSRYKLRFSFSHDTPLELVDPDTAGIFRHQAYQYFLLFDYLPEAGSVIGISIDGFTLDKSKIDPSLSQSQATDYLSADLYWVSGMGKPFELRAGLQYDDFRNAFRDYVSPADQLDYFIRTLQLYTTAYHPFDEHMAWDLGLYVGQVKEQQDYLLQKDQNTLNESTQMKLRMGFEYSSADGRNTLQFNLSLNLDQIATNQGDGAGISYQSVF